MNVRLTEITDIIRSKNAGPYELTFDLIFKDFDWFEKVNNAGVINEDLICRLYGILPSDIINIVSFKPAKAIKITIRRPICSGDLGETDVYGAQQHAPFLDVSLSI
ncbi:MAG: DUF4387 domain-containing protein [Eubacteriales bacterium]|nr:DUF4387 domain-containing protein [Eubacteriales bacterium]